MPADRPDEASPSPDEASPGLLNAFLVRLTPKALGALLAFYEHRTFCFGVFANINSYDQMGVELGKRLANQVKPLLDSVKPLLGSVKPLLGSVKPLLDGRQAQKSAEGFDPSTLNLLSKVRNS